MAKLFSAMASVSKDDKVAFLSRSDIAITTLFKGLTGEMGLEQRYIQEWGCNDKSEAYLPKDMTDGILKRELKYHRIVYVNTRQQKNKITHSYVASLGRMLFSGDDML